MNTDNPLAIVGVTPTNVIGISIEHLVRMSPKELRLFVKGQKRVYAQMYHPNGGEFPDAERLAMLNGAIDSVSKASDREIEAWQRALYSEQTRLAEGYANLLKSYQELSGTKETVTQERDGLKARVGDLSTILETKTEELAAVNEAIGELRRSRDNLSRKCRDLYNHWGSSMLFIVSTQLTLELVIQGLKNPEMADKGIYGVACVTMAALMTYATFRLAKPLLDVVRQSVRYNQF